MSLPKVTGNLFRAGPALAGLTRDDLANHAGLSRESIEHTIDEFCARRGPEPFRQSHRLLNRDAWWRVPFHQLGGAEAEDGSFDRAKALETPGIRGDYPLERVPR